MNYENMCKRVVENGEPGFAWLANMRDYGRMIEPPVCFVLADSDYRAVIQ